MDYPAVAEELKEDYELDEQGKLKRYAPSKETQLFRDQKSDLRETGFIAQEVESTMRNMQLEMQIVDAPDNENGLYGLRYSAFVPHLVRSVQQLADENASLRAELLALQSSLKEIQATLQKQKLEVVKQTTD